MTKQGLFAKAFLRRGSALQSIAMLGAGVVGLGIAAPAVAQTSITTDAPQKAPDEIIVTGSRISNPNLEQSSPVVSIDAKEIARQAPTSVENILRELPGSVIGNGDTINNGTNGTASFNLRGLGSNRNLVLLNGRRVVPSGLGNVTDLNNIPIALIERFDQFTGGAVTTYGADAIAGVVNFVTRQDFSGLQVTAQNGITERGDGNKMRLDMVMGANFDDGRGNVTIGLNYTDQKSVLQGRRPYAFTSLQSTCTGVDSRRGAACDAATSGVAQGSNTAVPASLFFPLPDTGAFADGARFDPSTGTITPGLSDFNFSPLNLFQTPLKRYSIFAQGKYEVASNIEAYGEAFYSRNTVRMEIAPTGTFTNQFQVPLNNQFLTSAQRIQLCSFAQQSGVAIADCPTAIANGTEIPLIAARRFVETGPRITTYNSNTYQITVGVRGKLSSTLNFDIFGQHGEADRRNVSSGSALADRVQAALRGCPAGSPVRASCVPINIFGAAGSITPAMLNYISIPTSTFVETSFSSAQAVIDGDFGVSSPFADNPIGVAVGAEYRAYSGNSFGDLPSQTPGAVLGAGGATPTVSGSYHSYEGFAEINAPLITDRPFFHNLTAEAGIRYADYSTSGGNTTWKVGGSWAPVRDLRFRAAYTTAVRAPNIGELFTPVTTSLATRAVDPCQGSNATVNATRTALCTAQLAAVGLPASRIGSIPAPIANQVNTTGGGNPNLAPETARTLTIGGVLTPSVLPGFSVSLDYYRVKVRNAITSPTISDIVDGCFAQSSATFANCQAILRNPLTGGLSGDPSTTQGVILQASNLGFLQVEGYDLTVNYSRKFGAVSALFTFNGNYTTKSQFQSVPSAFIRECVGYYSASCDPVMPKFTWNARAGFGYENVNMSLFWRHLSSVRYEPRTGANDSTPPTAGTVGSFGAVSTSSVVGAYRAINAYDIFDANIGFDLTEKMTFSFLIDNLFDKQPPLTGNTIGALSSGNTFPSTYDALGRRYTVTVGLKF
ncbi:TonB-dependent receptor plug domain-containing protein [Sphingomonas sp. 2378]|uniref:TonB-dependent receptor plug domain-containing protein n=1 Tax=Sphingomonas sp. 2378 TaxID=1219748 RepID=UPI00311B2025